VENKILHGDSLDLLKDMDDNSVDSVVTDPPYGYSFMGKDWDKALPPIEIWKECVRVLKPGGFAFVMSAPRSDVHSRMCLMLEEAGFRIDFTPIAWTYATGFPKAMNIGKAVDKRLGKERKVVGKRKVTPSDLGQSSGWNDLDTSSGEYNYTVAESDEAKTLDGSYGGFQPKPAWENVIVCMKPLSEKGYLDQAMKNGKGITWFDDCRIPFQGQNDIDSATSGTSRYDNGEPETGFGTTEHIYGDNTTKYSKKNKSDYAKYVEKQKSFGGAKTIGEVNEGGNTFLGGDIKQTDPSEIYQKEPKGRFPANLLVQDDVLNDGELYGGGQSTWTASSIFGNDMGQPKGKFKREKSGTFSRYYDLDAWWTERIQELPLNVQATYPFLIVPKASKAEKNKGMGVKGTGSNTYNKKCLSCGKWQIKQGLTDDYTCKCDNPDWETPTGNVHPTVKPISLMSYLITLSSREDELVLDPFVGSGTTCIAAKLLNRKYIGMEMNDEYVVIAQERIKAHEPEQKQHDFF